MKPIYFKLTRQINEENSSLDRSKLLGAPVVPQGFLDDKLTDNDYFVAQINLEEIASFDTLLPKKGFLYFFIDVEDNQTKVLFTEEEPVEAITDINEAFDRDAYGAVEALYMDFDESIEEGNAILSDKLDDLDVSDLLSMDDYEILLLLDSLYMPEGDEKALTFASIAPYDGYYIFAIRKEDLKRHDFSHVLFIDWGD